MFSESSGGSRISRWGGRRPPMRTLFGENVCENERNGSCWGGGHTPVASPWICQWNRYCFKGYGSTNGPSGEILSQS